MSTHQPVSDELAERIAGTPEEWDTDPWGAAWRADYEGFVMMARVRVQEWEDQRPAAGSTYGQIKVQ